MKPRSAGSAGATKLVRAARDLVKDLRKLEFGPPVSHVYNPLEYAWATHRMYLEKYGQGRREVVMFGMNPGPFGMAQTGVPFGAVDVVRDWLGNYGPVVKPSCEHPKRPVEGFACRRAEVSGERLWGWAQSAFGTPERFFERFFVANYCPLCFVEESGKNRTPDRLKPHEKEPLLEACDRGLRRVIEHFEPRLVIGVGSFAEARARAVVEGTGIEVGRLLHPSPASPKANNDWAGEATRALAKLGVRV